MCVSEDDSSQRGQRTAQVRLGTLVSRGSAGAAIQGKRAAQWPADSWARLLFTLEPEEKTNRTNGRSLMSRNQVTSEASWMCRSPSPGLPPKTGSPCSPVSPALGWPNCKSPGCRPIILNGSWRWASGNRWETAQGGPHRTCHNLSADGSSTLSWPDQSFSHLRNDPGPSLLSSHLPLLWAE